VNNRGEAFSIGELARRAGISPDTVRHYEAKGVIQRPVRKANGYRVYSAETLPRIMLVRRALAIGFTLDELREVMRVRDSGGAPCLRVRDLTAGKLRTIDERLRELRALRKELCATLAEWDSHLARTPKHQRAYLLEKLSTSATRAATLHTPFKTTHAARRQPEKK
jgi:DNA-binding transcriptional MerR regulator